MELLFNYGFSVKDMDFGSHSTGIYRLPKLISNRFYPLRKLPKIKGGNKMGYRCNRKFFSIKQLKSILYKIEQVKIKEIDKKDCPF